MASWRLGVRPPCRRRRQGRRADGRGLRRRSSVPQAVHGEVIVADGCGTAHGIDPGHRGRPPVARPARRGRNAAHRRSYSRRRATGGTLCLISGGASSLLVQPRPPVRLADKIAATTLLLECGADIGELNCVRKHLSMVKGGGLAASGLGTARHPADLRRGRRRSRDDRLRTDCTGCDDLRRRVGSARTVSASLERVPAVVSQLLRDGHRRPDRRDDEAGRPGGARAAATSSSARIVPRSKAAAQAVRSRGWAVAVEAQPLTGETTTAARNFGVEARPADAPAGRATSVCACRRRDDGHGRGRRARWPQPGIRVGARTGGGWAADSRPERRDRRNRWADRCRRSIRRWRRRLQRARGPGLGPRRALLPVTIPTDSSPARRLVSVRSDRHQRDGHQGGTDRVAANRAGPT